MYYKIYDDDDDDDDDDNEFYNPKEIPDILCLI